MDRLTGGGDRTAVRSAAGSSGGSDLDTSGVGASGATVHPDRMYDVFQQQVAGVTGTVDPAGGSGNVPDRCTPLSVREPVFHAAWEQVQEEDRFGPQERLHSRIVGLSEHAQRVLGEPVTVTRENGEQRDLPFDHGVAAMLVRQVAVDVTQSASHLSVLPVSGTRKVYSSATVAAARRLAADSDQSGLAGPRIPDSFFQPGRYTQPDGTTVPAWFATQDVQDLLAGVLADARDSRVLRRARERHASA